MGAFKPLLPFGERSVVESCVESLRAGGVAEIVVVVGHRAAEVRERLGHLPVRFAVNDASESEMGVSIARGIAEISVEMEAVLIALADQPAVPPAAVREVIAERERSGARLIVPTCGGRGGHPVLVDLCFRPELLCLDSERGLRALFDAQRQEVRRVAVSSPYVARDMDTWDDYRALHLEVFGSLPEAPPPLKEG
jgi:CTP:molybdopterin cytidylyltransferase MocA